MPSLEPFQPRCLRASRWSPLHQSLWADAQKTGGLFESPGRAAGWRNASLIKAEKGFGAWLHWNLWRYPEQTTQIVEKNPAEIATAERVKAYVSDLTAINSDYTIYCRVEEFYNALRVMVPDQEWAWLLIAVKNLKRNAKSVRNKREHIKPAADIENLAIELMQAAEKDERLTRLEKAICFRDGLMIQFLIRRLLRITNLVDLTVGKTLHIRETTAAIVIPAQDMKSRRRYEVLIPEHVRVALLRYVTHYRQILLTTSQKAKNIQSDALWISRDGTKLQTISLHNAIRRRTMAKFGKPIPPHWFRDCAVTSLVHDAPASARLSSAILDHVDPVIGEKHYNQAEMIHSARRHSQLVDGYVNVEKCSGGT